MSFFFRAALAVYRALLFTFPEQHRREYREEMLETIQQRAAELRATRGRWSGGGLEAAGFWTRELHSLLKEGMRMRFASARRPASFSPLVQLPLGIRLAVRSLRRSPAFSLTVILTLTLGIGATTVIFSFVDGILLTPLPYEEPSGLVMFETFHGESTSVSEPEFMGFRSGTRLLESVAAVRSEGRVLGLDGKPRRVITQQVTHELFPILGVRPLMGRGFTSEEDVEGAPAVAVLSHGLWQELYGADPGALGRSLELDGEPYEIVGVMPEGFYFPSPETALWTPYRIDPANLDYWNNHYLNLYGRLVEGVSLEAARDEIEAMGRRFVEDHPEYLRELGFSASLNPLTEVVVGDTRTPLLVLLGAVVFLLLIGCTNVANLMLARGEARRQDTAVRAALGASRRGVLLESLVESSVLTAVGGSAGVALAIVGVRVLRSVGSSSIPRVEEVTVDPGVLAFAALVTLLTTLLFGLLPSLTASRADLQSHLREGGRARSASKRGYALRRSLVATEVALAVVLVIGAGIMLRSLAKLNEIDTGFRTEDVLALRVGLPESEAGGDEAVVGFFREVVDRVEGLPGVESAGLVSNLPLAQGIGLWSILLKGREVGTIGDAPVSEIEQVTPGYFQALGVSLVEGRFLDPSDGPRSMPVALINEAFARQHWGGEDVVGRQVKLFSSTHPWMTVVGVVRDVRHRSLLADVRPKMYVPHAQAGESLFGPSTTMNVVVHGQGVDRLAPPIKALVNRMDGGAMVYDVRTMKDVKRSAMADRSHPTALLTLFGLFALFLASVGVFGLVSVHVSQSRRDLGVHIALGATAQTVRGLVLTRGMIPVVLGLVLGLGGAVALTRLMAGLLYQTSPLDPPIFLGVAGLLLLVAGGASLWPALRAARLDPMEVLRSE